MSLDELVRSVGIIDAHIVDDAFDSVPGSGLQPAAVQTFLDSLDEAHFNLVAVDLGDPEANEEWIIAQLGTVEGAQRLFAVREKYGPAVNLLFEEFLQATEPERARLKPLIECLNKLGIRCHTFGRHYDADTQAAPQLLFVDLKLNERQVQIEQPIRVVKQLLTKHPNSTPFIFLISTLTDALNSRRIEFRDKCQLFATQFETLPKQVCANEEELRWFLDDHARAYPMLRNLQSHIEGWGSALDRAKQQLQSALRCLDIADYFVLHQNTVAAEQVPLGTYMTDLLLEYVGHQVESAGEISTFAKSLDAWDIHNLTRSRFNVQPIVGDIFSANVLHAPMRLRSEAERGRGPEHGFLQLGDVFFLSTEIAKNQIGSAVVVLSPACDLVRPSDLEKRKASVFLCEGEVEKLKSAAPRPGVDGLDPVILRYPAEGGVQYVIRWNKKRPRTWSYEEFQSLAEPSTSWWTLVGRLRPLYALQLQHALTADLSRIGVQRPPAQYMPFGVELLVAAQGRWKTLLQLQNDPSAGAICEDKGRGRITIILSDSALRDARAALLRWATQNAGEAHAKDIEQFFRSDDSVRALMSFTVALDDAAKSTHTYFPPGQSPLVAFFKQNQGSKATFNGGRPLAADENSRVVFRFVTVRD